MLTMGSQHSVGIRRFPVGDSAPTTSSSSVGIRNHHESLEGTVDNSHRGTLVVVNPAEPDNTKAKDPTQERLDAIPFFNTILHRSDNLAWSREGETVRHQLDSASLSKIGVLVQSQFKTETRVVAKDQATLTIRIKELDLKFKQVVKGYTERQRAFARYADGLNRLTHFAHSLGKCQAILNDCRRTAQLLNAMLPETDRLEGSAWEDTELVTLEDDHR